MVVCSPCGKEVAPGTRWCPHCRVYVGKPEAGLLALPVRRLAAHLFDWGVPAALLFLNVVTGVGMLATMEMGSDGPAGIAGFLNLVFTLALVAYPLWALYLFRSGTTPGKNLLGMRVVLADGAPANWKTMVVREWFGKWISTVAVGIGLLWVLVDENHQGWHDRMVTTYVVQRPAG